MDIKLLINQLELSYSPISNYFFNISKHIPEIQDIFSSSRLYIIAQRPEINFENIICINNKKIKF